MEVDETIIGFSQRSLCDQGRTWIYPLPFVEYTKDNIIELFSINDTLSIKYPNLIDRWHSDLFGVREPLRSCLHGLYVDIFAYAANVPEKRRCLDIEYIFCRTLTEGPSFAKWLDGFKAYVCTRIFKRKLPDYDQSDYFEHAQAVTAACDKKFSIAHLYRANDLFNWSPPELDVKPIIKAYIDPDEKSIEEFELRACAYLRAHAGEMFVGMPWQSLAIDSTSQCQEGLVWLQKNQPPALERAVSKIVQVPRELKECRAATIETYSSALRIRWINAVIRRYIHKDPRYGLRYNAEDLHNLLSFKMKKKAIAPEGFKISGDLKNAQKYYRSSYCRDFVKEGLTKPHAIATACMKAFKLCRPQEYAFENAHFYDSWVVNINDEIIHALRGHGLGMGNDLTTFMQMIIEDVNVHNFNAPVPYWSAYVNDDAVAIFDEWLLADNYMAIDRRTCRLLGLDFKEKSSFISVGSAVLCEVYYSGDFPNINNKEVFDKIAFASLYKRVNASHCRHDFAGHVYEGISTDEIMNLLKYWSTIVCDNEQGYVYACGGWISLGMDKVDTSWAQRFACARMSVRETALFRAYQKISFLGGFRRKKLEIQPKVWDIYTKEYCTAKGFPKTIDSIKMFRPSKRPEENVEAWKSFQYRLIEEFKRNYASRERITYGEAWLSHCNKNPTRDILPPMGYYKMCCQETAKTSKLGTNPFHGFEPIEEDRFYNIDPQKLEYLLLDIPNPDINAHVITEQLKLRRLEGLKPRKAINRDVYLTKKHHINYLPTEEEIHLWHDPFAIKRVASFLEGKCCCVCPRQIPQEKNKLLLKKKNASLLLTAEEHYLLRLLPQQAQTDFLLVYDDTQSFEWTALMVKSLYNYKNYCAPVQFFDFKTTREALAEQYFLAAARYESEPRYRVEPEEPEPDIITEQEYENLCADLSSSSSSSSDDDAPYYFHDWSQTAVGEEIDASVPKEGYDVLFEAAESLRAVSDDNDTSSSSDDYVPYIPSGWDEPPDEDLITVTPKEVKPVNDKVYIDPNWTYEDVPDPSNSSSSSSSSDNEVDDNWGTDW